MAETNVIENDKQLDELEPENPELEPEVVTPVVGVVEIPQETRLDNLKFGLDNLDIMSDFKAFPD